MSDVATAPGCDPATTPPTTDAATAARKQCAKQLLRSTATAADAISDKLSEKTTFVIDAAVRAFAELPTDEQVKRCYAARVAAAG